MTVLAMISDRDFSLAIGSFLRRLKYRLGKLQSHCEYLLMNEWAEGHRHVHILVRTDADLTRQSIRALWAKTLPGVQFTCHCESVRNPEAIANYLVKNLKDDSKKELPPRTFTGRIYTYSRKFFTKPVPALWKEQVEQWYPAARKSSTASEQGFIHPGGANHDRQD